MTVEHICFSIVNSFEIIQQASELDEMFGLNRNREMNFRYQ